MDRFEVTNREYRGFVDSGGYQRQEFWTEPIEKDGRALPWREAMRLMTDRTGRTGPATWEAGDYPRGSGDDPVGGLSWYEAMAYARFRGKSLPTVIHWSHAAGMRGSSWIVPASNFSGRAAAPVSGRRRDQRIRNVRHGRERPRVVSQPDRWRAVHPGRRLG